MAISPKVYVADSVKVGQFELSEGNFYLLHIYQDSYVTIGNDLWIYDNIYMFGWTC